LLDEVVLFIETIHIGNLRRKNFYTTTNEGNDAYLANEDGEENILFMMKIGFTEAEVDVISAVARG